MRQILLLLMLIITSAVYAYEPVVSNVKIWNYNLNEVYHQDVLRDENYSFSFRNASELSDSQYLRLNVFEETGWGSYSFPSFLMKEENQKVSILYNEDFREFYKIEQESGNECFHDGDEILMMDFNLAEGDSYKSIHCPFGEFIEGTCIISDFTVIETGEVSLGASPPRKYQEIEISYRHGSRDEIRKARTTLLEGVGFIDFGYADYSRKTSLFYMPTDEDIITLGFRYWTFQYVTNLDTGDVITGSSIYNALSGIDTISEGLPSSGKMYDLNGREIRDPLPGTVYIRDGRKAVAE